MTHSASAHPTTLSVIVGRAPNARTVEGRQRQTLHRIVRELGYSEPEYRTMRWDMPVSDMGRATIKEPRGALTPRLSTLGKERSMSSNVPEEWRPVVGYEDLYEVSNWGRVKRLAGTPQCKFDRLLKAQIGRGGYPQVPLNRAGIQKGFYLHSLVAEAFIGPRPAGFQINHKDGVKTNPTLDNLEYTTAAGNIQHAVRTGLRVAPSGQQHYLTKLTEAQIFAIRTRYANGELAKNLAKDAGLTIGAFYQIVTGQTWKNAGGPITDRGHAKGNANSSSKLNEASVRYIRASTDSAKVLAAKFGTSTRSIEAVRAGETWGWLK